MYIIDGKTGGRMDLIDGETGGHGNSHQLFNNQSYRECMTYGHYDRPFH